MWLVLLVCIMCLLDLVLFLVFLVDDVLLLVLSLYCFYYSLFCYIESINTYSNIQSRCIFFAFLCLLFVRYSLVLCNCLWIFILVLFFSVSIFASFCLCFRITFSVIVFLLFSSLYVYHRVSLVHRFPLAHLQAYFSVP